MVSAPLSPTSAPSDFFLAGGCGLGKTVGGADDNVSLSHSPSRGSSSETKKCTAKYLSFSSDICKLTFEGFKSMFALKAYEDQYSKFIFDMERADEEPLCGCATAIPVYLFYYFILTTSNFSTPTKKATFSINYVCLSVFLPTCVWYRMTLYHKIQQVLRSVILPLLTSSRCSWRYTYLIGL